MTRVNIDIPDELHKKAKVVCALKGTTLTEYLIGTISTDLKRKK